MKNYYRQGDIILIPVEKLPRKATQLYVGKSYVLAKGETTGHRHLLVADEPETKIAILKDKKGRMYLKVENGKALLTHEEHKALEIEPSFYIVRREREFDYFADMTKSIED